MSRMAASTRNFIGIKHLRVLPTLGAVGVMGDDISDMIDAGVDPGVAQILVAKGATEDQIQSVIMNPDSEDASLALLNQLTGNSPAPGQPVTSAANYPLVQMQQQSVSVAGIDLTDIASWLSISDQLQSLGIGIQQVTAMIAANPALGQQPGVEAGTLSGDVSALQASYQGMLSKWNSLFAQAQATTTVTMPDGSVQTIQQAGMNPQAIIITAAIISAAAVIIAGLHTANNYLANVQAKAQIPVQQTASATQQALIGQIASATSQAATATDPNTRAALLAQANVLANQLASTGYVAPGQVASPLQASLASSLTGIGSFFSTYGIWIIAGIVAIKLVPPLIKKL